MILIPLSVAVPAAAVIVFAAGHSIGLFTGYLIGKARA